MPVKYSGARAAGEIEVKAVQQFMFEGMRSAVNIRSWAQARQWWVAHPPGTLKRWQEEATRVAADMSTKVQATRVEHLVSTSLQPAFDLVKSDQTLVVSQSSSSSGALVKQGESEGKRPQNGGSTKSAGFKR